MGHVPWVLRDNPTNPSALCEPQYSDRNRLPPQYSRGWELDDAFDIDKSFQLSSFALGSMRNQHDDNLKFMSGFDSNTDQRSCLSFNFDRRWIYVNAMPTNLMNTPPALFPLEVEIPFEDITTHGVHITRVQMYDYILITLTVKTCRPGQFYISLPYKPYIRRATERDFVYSVGRESTAGIDVNEMKALGYMIHEGHAGPIETMATRDLTVQVGALLTWQFEFRMDESEGVRFMEQIRLLAKAASKDGCDILAHCDQKRIPVTPVESRECLNPDVVLANVPFCGRYRIEELVSRGIIVTSEIPALLAALEEFCISKEHQVRVLTALFLEETIHDLNKTVSTRAKQLSERSRVETPGMVWVHRCVVTPTRLILLPPELEVSNEALRQHRPQQDRFLCVTFADEDDRVHINPVILDADKACPEKSTLARIRRALNSGLIIAGRHYVFLAYDSASAGDQSCWFVSEDRSSGFSADSVRYKLGLGQIRNPIVAQHAMGMGIPFTSTRVVESKLTIGRRLPDLFDGEVCATYGVGRCGEGVAQHAARAFGFLSGPELNPSAIEIRCGGIKGVLSVWPQLCSQDEARFRPSQIMFKTPLMVMQYGLSVVRVSQFRHAFLSRQSILLLSHLGVRMRVFRDLFSEAITQTRGMVSRLTAAKPIVSKSDLQTAPELTAFPLKAMLDAGYNREPLFVNVCKALMTHLLHEYKWQGKLQIKKSVYLMGIADELGVLNEGEVFCQYDNPAEPDEGPIIVREVCAIMRATPMHPGDIREVTAVDHPRLHHLKNVIVFSVVGQSLPHMLSGGDLDGDDYALIWDERLVPRLQVQEADYTAVPPRKKKGTVSIEDVKEGFIDYLKNDVLSDVCNAHMAHADRGGANSRVCWDLARQARIAAEFPKTGVPAHLYKENRPVLWPTFMTKDVGNSGRNFYESVEVVGRIFKLILPDPSFTPVDIRKLPSRADLRLEKYNVPDSVLLHAFRLKQEYDAGILGLMRSWRVTEVEVVTGITLPNPVRCHHNIEFKETVLINYRSLVETALAAAREFLSSRMFRSSLTPMQVYAIAAYQVTYVGIVSRDVQMQVGFEDLGGAGVGQGKKSFSGPAPLISFPWVFWEALCSLPNLRSPPIPNNPVPTKPQARRCSGRP